MAVYSPLSIFTPYVLISSKPRYLQLAQDSIGTRNIDIPRALLVLGIRDGTVLLNNHSPTTVAVAHASVPTVLLAEEGLGVGQQDNFVIGRDLVDLAPGAHDEGVVGRDHGDLVDALLLQVADLLDVWGQVIGLAAGGESACDMVLGLLRG